MNNDNPIITDTSEVLTNRDLILLRSVKELKKQILAYIEVPILVQRIKEIINRSNIIYFKNERAEKYIKNSRPVFNVLINKDAIRLSPKYADQFAKAIRTKQAEMSLYTNVIFDEVISEVTKFINDSISNDPTLEDYIESMDIFRQCTQEEREYLKNSTHVVSTLFGIRFSDNDPSSVLIEMVI